MMDAMYMYESNILILYFYVNHPLFLPLGTFFFVFAADVGNSNRIILSDESVKREWRNDEEEEEKKGKKGELKQLDVYRWCGKG